MGVNCCSKDKDKDEPEIITIKPQKNISNLNQNSDNNNLIIVNPINPIQNPQPLGSYISNANSSNDIYQSTEQIIPYNEKIDSNKFFTINSSNNESHILNEKQIEAIFDKVKKNFKANENLKNRTNDGQNIIIQNYPIYDNINNLNNQFLPINQSQNIIHQHIQQIQQKQIINQPLIQNQNQNQNKIILKKQYINQPLIQNQNLRQNIYQEKVQSDGLNIDELNKEHNNQIDYQLNNINNKYKSSNEIEYFINKNPEQNNNITNIDVFYNNSQNNQIQPNYINISYEQQKNNENLLNPKTNNQQNINMAQDFNISSKNQTQSKNYIYDNLFMKENNQMDNRIFDKYFLQQTQSFGEPLNNNQNLINPLYLSQQFEPRKENINNSQNISYSLYNTSNGFFQQEKNNVFNPLYLSQQIPKGN